MAHTARTLNSRACGLLLSHPAQSFCLQVGELLSPYPCGAILREPGSTSSDAMPPTLDGGSGSGP